MSCSTDLKQCRSQDNSCKTIKQVSCVRLQNFRRTAVDWARTKNLDNEMNGVFGNDTNWNNALISLCSSASSLFTPWAIVALIGVAACVL